MSGGISSHPPNPENVGITNEFIWVFAGTLSTLQNDLLPKFARSASGNITDLVVLLQGAPTGDDAIFDFLVDGVSIGTVTVAAGDEDGTTHLSTPSAFAAGAVFTAEITQIGSINPGTTATMIARLA